MISGIPHVKTDIFEGPLDLLLALVKEEELDVRRIPISRILADFLAYLEEMVALDLEIWSDYLLMAATLIYIKSRALLPEKEGEERFDEEGERVKEELVRKLVEYKKFKEAASILEDMLEKQMDIFVREAEVEEGSGTLFDILVLVDTFRNVMRRAKSGPPGHEIRVEDLKIEDFMDAILSMVRDGVRSFEEIMVGYETRIEVVIAFLAILELMKRGLIWIKQESPYGVIWIGAR